MVNGFASSSGPDRIPTKVVKLIFPVIVSALTRLVNFPFESSVFQSASQVLVLLFFLKVDQGMILQIIFPYLFYQCLVKFWKSCASLTSWFS